MTKFIFVRHGQSKANETGYLIGGLETPLSSLGEKQAEAVCKYILNTYNIDAIYSSPLSRAYDTVKGVAKALGISIHKEEDLRELYVGKWEGLSYTEIKRDYAEWYLGWATNTGCVTPPDGESMAEVQKRVISKLTEIAKKENGKTVLIGTHAAVMRVIQCYAQHLTLPQMKSLPWVYNTSVSEMDFDGENFYIYKFGFDGHLANLK